MDDPAREQFTPLQMPSRKQQSVGALVSIVVIVLMVVIGAFYVWGERVAERTRSLQTSDVSPAPSQ
jgi:hypothetical protein